MVPTSWRVREGGGAVALMPWCYAARNGLVRLVVRWPVGTGALSDTTALGISIPTRLAAMKSRSGETKRGHALEHWLSFLSGPTVFLLSISSSTARTRSRCTGRSTSDMLGTLGTSTNERDRGHYSNK